MLPLDWAVQNQSMGALAVVKLLLQEYPESLHVTRMSSLEDDWRRMARSEIAKKMFTEAIAGMADGVTVDLKTHREDMTPAFPQYQQQMFTGTSVEASVETMSSFVGRLRKASVPAHGIKPNGMEQLLDIYSECRASALFRVMARDYFANRFGEDSAGIGGRGGEHPGGRWWMAKDDWKTVRYRPWGGQWGVGG